MLDRFLIEQRLNEDECAKYAPHYAEVFSRRILDDCLPELEHNVCEWIEHRPLSDIKIDGLSINDLYETWGTENFAEALRILKDYKRNHEWGKHEIITFGQMI